MLNKTTITRKILQLRKRVAFDIEWEPCSDEQIDAVETDLGVKFPLDYRMFLKNVNLAFIYMNNERKYVAFSRPKTRHDDDVLVGCIYGIRLKDDSCDIRRQQQFYFFDQWIGAPWLSIGDGGDMQICLNVESGAVAAHRMHTVPAAENLSPAGLEYPPGFDVRTELIALATSFTEFFMKLNTKKW